MRTRWMRITTRMAMLVMLIVAGSGCSDALAVAGLSDLSGYWSGDYESGLDFYLELDDDIYGLYGRAGLTTGGQRGNGLRVDGERDGSHVVFYPDDATSGDLPLFEGRVASRDRMVGLLYLDPIPQRVVLRRR
jgi:hypothetical protein